MLSCRLPGHVAARSASHCANPKTATSIELFDLRPTSARPCWRTFPRAYLDVNREPYEFDPRMFREDLPGYANTSLAPRGGGLGTIPRIVCEGEEIYREPLRLDDVLQRIETIYRPYHRTLVRPHRAGADNLRHRAPGRLPFHAVYGRTLGQRPTRASWTS